MDKVSTRARTGNPSLLNVPVRPQTPPIEVTRTGYRIPGVVTIIARPHRSRDDAKRLAQRVQRDKAYLPVMLGLKMPGVTDLRATD